MRNITLNSPALSAWNRPGGALPALLLVLSLAACGGKDVLSAQDQQSQAFADLREAVTEAIPDEQRQAVVLQHVDQLQQDFGTLIDAVSVRRTELRHLNADYDATREQFREFIDRYDARIAAARVTVTARHVALVNATTPDEWESLRKADTKAMKKLVGTIQGI